MPIPNETLKKERVTTIPETGVGASVPKHCAPAIWKLLATADKMIPVELLFAFQDFRLAGEEIV